MALLRIKKTMNFVQKWKIWCCHHKDILEYLQQQGDLQVANVKNSDKWCGDLQGLQREVFWWWFLFGFFTASVDPLYQFLTMMM